MYSGTGRDVFSASLFPRPASQEVVGVCMELGKREIERLGWCWAANELHVLTLGYTPTVQVYTELWCKSMHGWRGVVRWDGRYSY